MATPMRHGPSQQGQGQGQGRTPSQIPGAAPTPPVSTPFSNSQAHTAFSPAQGSHHKTSPQAFRKSPANSHTLKGMPDGAGPVNFDSPSAAAALGALGINDFDNLNINTMGMGMGRSDDDDRKRRFDNVAKMIKDAGKGTVSKEGLERLARSMGLEVLWEDNIVGGSNSKNLFIAGNSLSMEITITNHIVENVQVTYPECAPTVQDHAGKAADILLRDLKLEPGEWALTKTLEKFKPNLERIFSLDKFSILPTLNCYDAIDGIYQSLLKLHNWDVAKLKEDPRMQKFTEDYVKLAALYSRHGYPQMHARGRIGLSLDYWKTTKRFHDSTVDDDEKRGSKTWSLLIECAFRDPTVLVPIRVSKDWISDAIEKTATAEEQLMQPMTGPILDWQEPEGLLVPSGAGGKTEGTIGSELRMAEVMFEAVFNPPLIVSSGVAAQMYTTAGINPPGGNNTTFDALVFPVPAGTHYDPTESRIITHNQPVMLSATATSTRKLRLHQNTLNTDRAVYGETLTKIPFSHPRQLIEMLPVLRQYAFLQCLLTNSFKKNEYPDYKIEDVTSIKAGSANDDFDAFMNNTEKSATISGSSGSTIFPVDIALTAHPVPKLRLVFPFKKRTANITLEIQLGGKVHIISDNIFNTDVEGIQTGADPNSWNGPGQRSTVEDWENALEIAEHLGKWIERIKYKFNDQ